MAIEIFDGKINRQKKYILQLHIPDIIEIKYMHIYMV